MADCWSHVESITLDMPRRLHHTCSGVVVDERPVDTRSYGEDALACSLPLVLSLVLKIGVTHADSQTDLH